MKLLNKLSLAVLVLIPGFAVAHPGHDQSMTWVHSFEAFGIVLAVAIAVGLAIRYSKRND